ncbi:hypothetical protein FOA43_000266 [Brettanomyces nanus]|uniref:Amidohydrolase-related domain-containing protein n=1 Tax=Eeniella nana TaxID=13502 RepID=A0A875RYG8_EENNA|nr:uncharacterized protein FOA43_000266 [Brettanomyces nanus]QPG72962.1 hypothetical protein FOA43_000266 [Brettanomyces nanus]
MAKTVLTGGDILTLDEEDSILTHHCIVVDQETGLIEKIVPEDQYTAADDDTVVDCTDQVVMPGLVDMHFHSAVARGWNDFMPLKEYLEECWYPSIRALDDESCYWVALASYLEAIKSGTTHVNDMYRFVGSLAKAAQEIGIRATLCNDVALPENEIDTLDDARESITKYNDLANGRIKVRVGIEWLPLADKQMLVEARELADELHTGIHIHLNESPVEVEIVKKQSGGLGPAELAYEAGILGPDCIAAHCVHLSDREIGLMAKTHTFISHNPSSNAKLGNGIARLFEWQKAGVTVGLGHDAAECNNSRDMFEVMKFCSLIHRANLQDPTVLQAKQVLKMCCINGNIGLNYTKNKDEVPVKIGLLKEGYKGDIITLDIMNEKFIPITRGTDPEHYYSNIVFSCNGSVVRSSVIDGQLVMKDRKMTNINERQVIEKANYYFNKIKNTIHK